MGAIFVPSIASDLDDVPTRTGQALKFLRVNAAESGHEYATASGYDATTITDPYIDIREKGAVSGSNSSTAINAAITQAAGGVGKVLIPAGNFIVDATINMASGVKLVGVGPKSILTAITGLDTPVILGSGISNSTIKDFKIDGNIAGQASGQGRGIQLSGCDNCHVENMDITGTYSHPIFIFNASSNIWVEGNRLFDNGSQALVGSGGLGPEGWPEERSVYVFQSSRVTIHDNIISGSNGFGLSVDQSSWCIVSENNISNSINYDGMLIYRSDHINVGTNVIETMKDSGIVFERCTFISAHGNTIRDIWFVAIYLVTVDYGAITGNIIENAGQAGNNNYNDIQIGRSVTDPTNYSKHNTIIGNTIIAIGANKTKYGIDESNPACDYNIVTGNALLGQVTGKIRLLGTNSIQANNT